jgi:hypothetical protein
LFDFNETGYRVNEEKRLPVQAVMVHDINEEYLKHWENAKPIFLGKLRLMLSTVLPFRNCASVIGDVVGERARSPDKLFDLIKER